MTAVLVAVAGTFVHRWASPLGIVLAVGGAAAVAALARACSRSRAGLSVVAALWLAAVLTLAFFRPGNDLVVAGDDVGLLFLFGGAACHAVVLGMGAETRAPAPVP